MNIDVNLVNPGELIIREGEALKPVPPVKIKVDGTIDCVSDYIGFRKVPSKDHKLSERQSINPNTAVIQVFRKSGKIQFFSDPNDFYGTEISGSLLKSEELKTWPINNDQEMTREALIKLIRFNRSHFSSPDQHTKVLESLMKFSAKTSGDIAHESDNRGNKNDAYQLSVKTQLPKEFVLDIPIYSGFKSHKFRVEICFSVSDQSVRFWLESVELKELLDRQKEEILSKEIELCEGLAVIYID